MIMKYFRANDGKIWGFDEQQVEDGYGSDMVALTPEETDLFLHPPITPEQILWNNTNDLNFKSDVAARVMAPILVSLQLGDATDDETLRAKAWQKYYRSLRLVDLTVTSPEWPTPPEQ
ncbi:MULTISPECIES: tail fiber assembly protein [unclassified Pseudomonas]|uniref:tail fiber assembly protein n=1 Tax=unclassified Pseudomonas TaxID=196821 RepID=UPI0030D8EFAC